MSLNPRQEKFCQLYHESDLRADSYAIAYDCSKPVAASNAWRLLQNAEIQARLEELRGESRELCRLSREHMLDYAARVLETPIGDIDENSPLCEEISHTEHGTKLKMFSKSAAFDKIVRMCGYNEPEKVEISAESELIDMIRGVSGGKE